MESLVLCPEELCLGPPPVQSAAETSAPNPPPRGLLGLTNPVQPGLNGINSTNNDGGEQLTIWTSEAVEKGTRFLPWKGTVRSDKLKVFDKLPEFDVSCSCLR